MMRALVGRLRPATVLEIRLSGAIGDVASTRTPFTRRSTSLLDLLEGLRHAETEPKLSRVVVRVEHFRGGLGRAEELRVALRRVADAGKEVVLFADQLSLAGYWLALGASRIVLSPTGAVDVVGVASQFTLLRGLLDKAGVRARLVAKGRYKSMRERFSEEQISDANREMLTSLVGDLYRQLQERISAARGIDESAVRALIDQGPFRGAEALALGLVDELNYEQDVRDEWKKSGKVRSISVARTLRRHRRRFTPARPPRVALLEVEGAIAMGEDGQGLTGGRTTGVKTFVAAAERIEKDASIKAIVLRVNSPGGSALASDLMWHALGRATKGRPLFVSMGDVAASGGYYVSGVAGARIYANPSTLTGSIGVVGGKFEIVGLLDKLGIRQEVIAVGENATFHLPTERWTAPQLKKMEREIDALYGDFVAKMADARGTPAAELELVAQGRVWTGAQAHAGPLVDQLGGLRDVLDAVRAELGLDASSELGLAAMDRPTLIARLRTRFASGALALALPRPSMVHERTWFRMPFEIELS